VVGGAEARGGGHGGAEAGGGPRFFLSPLIM